MLNLCPAACCWALIWVAVTLDTLWSVPLATSDAAVVSRISCLISDICSKAALGIVPLTIG